MLERWKPWMLIAGVVVALAGCKTEAMPPAMGDDWGGAGQPPGACVDQDDDGFGPNCWRGPDCDDSRSTVTNECFLCARDAPGCKCAEEGKQESCGKVTAQIGKQTTCSSGKMVCRAGTWGACIPDNKAVETISLPLHSLGLGRATPCTGNPCDPYCRQFADTPDETLSTSGGLVGTDAGLTLDRGEGAWFVRDYATNDVCTGGRV